VPGDYCILKEKKCIANTNKRFLINLHLIKANEYDDADDHDDEDEVALYFPA
jgi:hypothetical protein